MPARRRCTHVQPEMLNSSSAQYSCGQKLLGVACGMYILANHLCATRSSQVSCDLYCTSPRSRDLVIFVLTDKQTDNTDCSTPCTCARDKYHVYCPCNERKLLYCCLFQPLLYCQCLLVSSLMKTARIDYFSLGEAPEPVRSQRRVWLLMCLCYVSEVAASRY